LRPEQKLIMARCRRLDGRRPVGGSAVAAGSAQQIEFSLSGYLGA